MMLHARNEYEVQAAIPRTRVTIITQMMFKFWSKRFELPQGDEMKRAAEEDELQWLEAFEALEALEALEAEWDSAHKQQDGPSPKQEEAVECARGIQEQSIGSK